MLSWITRYHPTLHSPASYCTTRTQEYGECAHVASRCCNVTGLYREIWPIFGGKNMSVHVDKEIKGLLKNEHCAEPAAWRWRTPTWDELENLWKYQIWQCTGYMAAKSGLWLNTLLNACALIICTHIFFTRCSLSHTYIWHLIININYCSIWVQLGQL